MLVKMGDHEFTECWDGVLYKKLSNYPEISLWEIQTVLDFMEYEKSCGRACEIEADEPILSAIYAHKKLYDGGFRVAVPEKITECTACPTYKGCMTDLVCHTSPIENAVKIFDCGSLLSPVRARGKTAAELKAEPRNAANDPEDYFDYIMFAWGNCQAGDRLVMERMLGRSPNENELADGFTPGVRFFFRYNDLKAHPGAVFEGVLPMKVRDEVVLKDYACAIIVPEIFRAAAQEHIPDELRDIVRFLPHEGCDIWQWSERVYEYARSMCENKQ